MLREDSLTAQQKSKVPSGRCRWGICFYPLTSKYGSVFYRTWERKGNGPEKTSKMYRWKQKVLFTGEKKQGKILQTDKILQEVSRYSKIFMMGKKSRI